MWRKGKAGEYTNFPTLHNLPSFLNARGADGVGCASPPLDSNSLELISNNI